MNNQEAFNIMVNHLRKQNKKSVDSLSDKCLYRGPNGLKCAIGCLIPDDEYSPLMEGKVISSIHKKVSTLKNLDRYFLVSMQDIHDQYYISQWETEFYRVARIYGLTLPPK